MKISSFHKSIGDSVELNMPLIPADFTYCSVLFDWTDLPNADIYGGPTKPEVLLDPEIEAMKPDYTLYPNIDYSMGYTYQACPRTCDFCKVPQMPQDETHHSIHDFHDERFNKICLMNNNTLADPCWRDTFQEIIDAKLTVIDENGYDLRLVTNESARMLSKIRFEGLIHFAWDYPEHEVEILKGLDVILKWIPKYKINIYVLIGHTTHDENMMRIEKLTELGVDFYIMPLDSSDQYQKKMRRWGNRKHIFKSCTWENYNG
jgi:hypothetical protein